MESRNTVITIVGAALLASVLTASLIHLAGNDSPIAANDRNALLNRVEQIEMQLQAEREARLELQEMIRQPSAVAVVQTVPGIESELDDLEFADEVSTNSLLPEVAPRSQFQQRRAERRAQLQPEFRKQALVAAGFAREEAARIIQIESEIALKELNDQYKLRREYLQQATEENFQQLSGADQLRAEIGDEYYARYLEANGWPISASIDTVMHGSPGQHAGLLPGDKIVAYDGKRVFSLQDVNNLTIQGTVGESVLIEIERDGNPLQLTLPRGPIGVSAGRGRFGR